MRHRVKSKAFSRDSGHRKSLYKNLVSSFVTYHQIVTTKAKAKAIQGVIDKLITKAMKGNLNQTRAVDTYLNNRSLVNQLVKVIAPSMSKRTSGFTRIINLDSRLGDNTQMARLEFTDHIKSKDDDNPKKPIKEADKKPAKPSTTKTTAKATNKKPTKTAKATKSDRKVIK